MRVGFRGVYTGWGYVGRLVFFFVGLRGFFGVGVFREAYVSGGVC